MTEAYRTWEQLSELEQLECTYCEMYKDAHGIKARWYKAESVEQARRDIENLSREVERTIAREAEEQQQAAVRFEKLVDDTIENGAKDRATALRWIHMAEATDGDDEFLCFKRGLPYGYFKKETVCS